MTKNKNLVVPFIAGILALMVGLSGVAGAVSRTVPNSQRGPIAHPLYGGSDYARQSSTTEAMACTGKCLLIGLIRGTGPASTEIFLRDTGTADNGSAYEWRFSFAPRESDAYANPIVFPILFSNGIAVDLSAASTGEDVHILYIDLD